MKMKELRKDTEVRLLEWDYDVERVVKWLMRKIKKGRYGIERSLEIMV
jgi:hypothetical protein